ncbi:nucleotidyl transferase AbiEii/AbiGii toxin family protein [Corynebacterium sp. LK2510]|uniref:nucleotidyl transferase AbiEii/AbiGii toxin family protein n=1 Tax=Corynebacterium sp. LK2510 TaxID=3110472 RepID=UPI0034CDC6EB
MLEQIHDLHYVVGEIGKHIDRERIMVVGARCRDIHQLNYRDHLPGRTTKDIDIALAIDTWEDFERLKAVFPSKVTAWQAISIGGVSIDLIPFGDLEKPPGEIVGSSGFSLNVEGFREVFAQAEFHRFLDGTEIKVASVPGFAVLKMHAWCDRWPQGVYKDAADLALVIAWYGERESLWGNYSRRTAERHLGDEDCMAAELLGVDAGELLGEAKAEVLFCRFSEDVVRERLAEELLAPGEQRYPVLRRREQVDALLEGLWYPQGGPDLRA